jgi:16S rRNA (cytosine967-C5)-methyltransferase
MRHHFFAGEATATQVSEAVFAYFRWRGWLDASASLSSQLRNALALAERFKRDPASFSERELMDKGFPAWVRQQVNLSPALARAFQSAPRLWLRARPGDGRKLAKQLGHCVPAGKGRLSDILQYVGEQDLFRTQAFHAGRFELQDISSQAVGLVCAPLPGSTWWDACAGQGGKTLHLSDLMENKGLIWASDRAEWRLKSLRRRAARAGVFNYRAVLWDGGPRLPTRTSFDGVLVDAPCSGIGTWGRNPHARWTARLEDVLELASVQRQLLANARAAVKPGGVLVYAVCTLTRAETVEVAAEFDSLHREFERMQISDPLRGNARPLFDLWLQPEDFGGNGLFVAAWRKTPEKVVSPLR